MSGENTFKKVEKPVSKPEVEKTKVDVNKPVKLIDLLNAQRALNVNMQPRVIQPQRKPVISPASTESYIKKQG